MSNRRQLLDGSPVPKDYSHTEIDPATGMQKNYIVLSPGERAKGFVKPVRRSYIHAFCKAITTMGLALSETYARDPNFYSGTFCAHCHAHFPLDQFHWEDGEPMEVLKQEAWNEKRKEEERKYRQHRINELRAEIARLEEQNK